MASIEKRGPYQFRAKVRMKGQSTVSKTFISRKDAEAWARMTESEMERGMYISRSEAENTTLAEALGKYIEEYIPKLAYSNREINRAKKILSYPLTKKLLVAIRTKDISDFINLRQKEKASPNTIRLDLALLSRLFEVAASDWGMESLQNPVKRASKPKLPQGRERRLKAGEEDLLLNTVSQELKPIIKFALETAMRRSEITNLTWDNVDFNKRIAYLPKTKNGESRSVPLSQEAVNILKSLVPENVIPFTGKVFDITPSRITKSFKWYATKAGLEDLRFHDLRHEATSRFFENTDLDMLEIKAITGHKSLQMLSRYTHLRSCILAKRLDGAKR